MVKKLRISIRCLGCHGLLFNYLKGGSGSLIKIRQDRIIEDFTKSPGACWQCGTQFGKPAMINNRPALKVVSNRVYIVKSRSRK